jgi:superfamily I DNA and/or RNA helicase
MAGKALQSGPSSPSLTAHSLPHRDDASDADDIVADSDTLSTFLALGRLVVEGEREAELHSLTSASAGADSPQLARMRVADTSSGIGGSILLALAPIDGAKLALGNRELQAGDYVSVSASVPSGDDHDLRAIVWRITSDHVVISADADAVDGRILDAKRLRVDKRGNDVTYKRQIAALTKLAAVFRHPVADVLFGRTSASTNASVAARVAEFLDSGNIASPTIGTPGGCSKLNAEQRAAVISAVAADQLAVIHGPPGTGKTATLASAIVASVRVKGERVLACAPSNVAADNLLERLVQVGPGLKCVRVGNPARLSSTVLERSLDSLLQDEFSSVGRQIQRDISVAQKLLWRPGAKRDEREQAHTTLRELRKEIKRRESDYMQFILEGADVVVTTVAGGADRKLSVIRGAGVSEDVDDSRYPFDSVFMDEAATALEPLAWCSMLRGVKCVLAGDDRQLPPTVLTRDYELRQKALKLTAFARARKVLGTPAVHLLTRQYRMNAVIGQFSSEEFYRSRLVHDESVAKRTLGDLVSSRIELKSEKSETGGGNLFFPTDLSACLLFIDTAGSDFFETTESGMKISSQVESQGGKGKRSTASHEIDEDVGSRLNEGEAGLVAAHVLNLVRGGVLASEIYVITPYSAQCRRLRVLLSGTEGLEGVECGTVDSMQGKEAEAIVFSAVRSSERAAGGIGFLRDSKRFNVAVTRAKRSFCLIGDSGTLANGHPVLERFISYVERRTLAEYRSAFSYM